MKVVIPGGSGQVGTLVRRAFEARGRVVPGRLLEAGFAFRHPDWAEAARDLVARRR